MGLKEDIEKLFNWFGNVTKIIWVYIISFFGLMGFILGIVSISVWFVEAGLEIPKLIFILLRLFDISTAVLLIFAVYAIIFWLIKKFYIPEYEKKRLQRIENIENKLREITREEIEKLRRKR
jgi:hypothetical protein